MYTSADCPGELISWIKELLLSHADKDALVNDRWLSANHVAAANQLLKQQFHSQNGLQDTCILTQKGVWASELEEFVQIVFISSNHWVCVSNKFSPAGSVDMFDSLHTCPSEDGSIVHQICSTQCS